MFRLAAFATVAFSLFTFAADDVQMVIALQQGTMKKDMVGPFASADPRTNQAIRDTIRVKKIIDKDSFMGTVITSSGNTKGQRTIELPTQIKFTGIDTSELVDGKAITSPVFRVVGTIKNGDSTIWHVEKWTKEYTAPKPGKK